MKLLLMIILSFSLLSVPVNIPAAQDDTAEETTTTETFGYYLSEDAYFIQICLHLPSPERSSKEQDYIYPQ